MMSGKRPCESASCDSTTGNSSYFPTTHVPDQTSVHTSGTHFPIEHSDSGAQAKRDPRCPVDTSTVDPKAIGDECPSMMQSSEKGPDSTFNPPPIPRPCAQQGAAAPPPYLSIELGSNHYHSYTAAVPQDLSQSPQQNAMEKLAGIWNLPVTILGYKTLYQLGLRLDPEMLPAQNWKMMAEYMEFNNWEIKRFEAAKSPTMEAIKAWSCGTHTIKDLIDILNRDMMRADVITDIPEYILQDVKRHQKRSSQGAPTSPYYSDAPLQSLGNSVLPISSGMSPPISSIHSQLMYSSYMMASLPSTPPFPSSTTNEVSYDEKPSATNSSRPVQVMDVQPSEPVLTYDAFVLCNVADKEFVVNQFLPKVEEEAKLKLCFAERDIPPGHFAFTDAMNYMFKRSRKLVVILSDEFFNSKEHEWQSNLAISQDPASRRQTIIPVKYKKLTNRNIFDYLGCCDLTKTMRDEWFWDKIINGIKA